MSTKELICGPEQIVGHLREAGVEVFVRDGKLRARPQNALTGELRVLLAAHKEEVLFFVQTHACPQNPQNPQNPSGRLEPSFAASFGDGAQNTQNAQNPPWDDVPWIEDRLAGIYALLAEALDLGYLDAAQRVGPEVVAALADVVRKSGGRPEEITRACRLLSREGSGNDVVTAALLAGYLDLLGRLAAHGEDVLSRRAALALMRARAAESRAGPVVQPDGRLART